MSIFSERLNEALRLRGVNQAWLSQVSNTSTANVSRYLNGTQNPPALEIIPKMAKGLNVTTDYLLGLTDSFLSNGRADPIDAILITCYVRASDSDKKVIWALLDKYILDSERAEFEKVINS